MTRVIGPPKSRRRKWTFLVALLVCVGFGVLVIPGALAVHDDGFQLDGDVTHACPAGNAFCSNALIDWADAFTVTDTATTESVAPNSSVIGASGSQFTSGTFIRDFQSGSSCSTTSLSTTFCTGDATTFATGSKDTLDINANACNFDHNVNSKIDIMNAYAIASTDPSTGHKVLYFGLEKNKDNGTNDVGFWFLQGDASCDASGGGHPKWTGTHTVNDVLVVSEFTNGGGVSNITAYRWVGGSNPLVQIASASGNGGDCKSASGGDALCATTNSGPNLFNTKIQTPWLTSDATLGVGRNQIVPPDFFEGGIDLDRAFSGSGGTVPSCFNTYIADTRSSTSLTATLFDYASGQLGHCTSGVTTAQKYLPNDSATVTVGGQASWKGTVTFTLYSGPDCGTTNADGTAGPTVLYSEGPISVFHNVAGETDTTFPLATHNTNVFVNGSSPTNNGATSTSWLVQFTSTTTGVPGSSRCESTTSTINDDVSHS